MHFITILKRANKIPPQINEMQAVAIGGANIQCAIEFILP